MIRRNFIKKSILAAPLLSSGFSYGFHGVPLNIGLAQWSFHRTIRSGKLKNLDFAKAAKDQFDINVVEFVNQFFFDKAKTKLIFRS